MKKSEIFDAIMSIVTDVCEVTEAEILNTFKRTQDIVDARVFVVYYCRQAGLSSYEIARIVASRINADAEEQYVQYKAKGVDRMYYSYLDRRHESIAFCLQDDDIYNAIKDRYSELFKSGMKKFPSR